jgi:hypothetical protein
MQRRVILIILLFFIQCSMENLAKGYADKKEINKSKILLLVLSTQQSTGSASNSGNGNISQTGTKPSSSSNARGTCEWILSGAPNCSYNYIEGACAELPTTSVSGQPALGGEVFWYNDTTSATCDKLGYTKNCSAVSDFAVCFKSIMERTLSEIDVRSIRYFEITFQNVRYSTKNTGSSVILTLGNIPPVSNTALLTINSGTLKSSNSASLESLSISGTMTAYRK